MDPCSSYKGTDLLYLNPKGVIPPEAVVKKGEHRQIPFRERKVFHMTSFAEDDHEKVQAEVQGKADVEVGKEAARRDITIHIDIVYNGTVYSNKSS